MHSSTDDAGDAEGSSSLLGSTVAADTGVAVVDGIAVVVAAGVGAVDLEAGSRC